MGRDSDGATQPMTLMFKIGNMDYVQNVDTFPCPVDYTELYFYMEQAVRKYGLKDYVFNFVRPYILRLPRLTRVWLK